MNNYHIYEEQAKGKYSVIFKARKKKKLQFVAIKRLEKTRKEKVYNQAKILSELSHQNIIRFYDFLQTKNHMWEITEYCPGGDLLKIIQYDKQLPEHTVRAFTLEIMAGMQYAHSKGIIICDIKPASILINEYGSIKIGDFGSAQKLVDLMGKTKGKKKGTPSYMAPELFEVYGVYSFQADIWALGCMMYELGQGNPPFVSTNFTQIAQLSRTALTPKIDSFSSDFNNLLNRLLQKDPVNRITWKEIVNHPWVRKQLSQVDVPTQHHFLQYIQERKGSRNDHLRVSHNFQNQTYGVSEKIQANDRRQIFEFQDYNEQESQQNAYLEEQQQMDETDDYINKLQVNMKKKNSQNNQETTIKTNKNQNIPNQDKNNIEKEGRKLQKAKLPNNKSQKKTKNEIKINSKIEDSSNINLFMQTLTSKPSIPVEDAINHQSDTAVKPIIGNKDIEVIESINFNKNQLGFSYIEPQTLAQGIVNNQMDDQLKKILDGMKGQDKVNVLGYFEKIVQNSEVANYLFKSHFIHYYMSLLKSYKQSSLRAKICQILGFLIRHATSIDSQILKYGIITGFVETVTKDKNQKVKRKAMAALGQLLFYGATQVDEDAMEWDISLSLISTLLKILKNTNEDELVRIYCCKSIQNITAQAQKVGLNFSQIDTLLVMVGCFNSTKNQGFKTSIMSSIHHMITLNPTLREIFLQKMPLQSIIQTFQDPETSSKTLQIFLWIFLQQFLKNLKSKQSRQLLECIPLLKQILQSIQSGSSVVKGRLYLFIYFLLKYDFKNISLVSESKLFHCIERHDKETGKYQSQGLQFIVSVLYQNFSTILQLCKQELQATVFNNSSLVERNSYIVVIYQMQSRSIFEEIFNAEDNIQNILNLFNLIQATKHQDMDRAKGSNKNNENQRVNYDERPYQQHFKNHYFMILQRIFTNENTTQKLQQVYATSTLPFLIGKLLKTCHNDIRYSCIKYIIYLVNFCLSEDFLYDSIILTSTSARISSLITTHLIPQLDALLDEGQVVANMIFKLMAEIFKNRPLFVEKYWESCKIDKPLQHLNQTATINVLKTIEYIFSCKNSSPQSKNFHLINQYVLIAVQLLAMYKQSGQQLFFEYPLSILINIQNNFPEAKLENGQVDSIFQLVVVMQSNEDVLLRSKAQRLIEILLGKNLFSQKGLNDWRQLSRKGMQNYEAYVKISSLKAPIKPNEIKQMRTQKQSRYT